VSDFRTNARDESIRAAITGVASELTPTGRSRWQFALLNGVPHVVTAKTDDEWLLLEADFANEPQGPGFFWEALVRNASLAGLAKLVLARDGGLRLRAEIPVLEGVDLTTRVGESCRGFEAVWTREGNHSSTDAPPAGQTEPIDLKGLCGEAGWPFSERGGGKIAVELEAPGGFCQALLSPTEHGVRIHCEVAALDSITKECRQAVAGFLLAASGLVRMGRASVDAKGTSPVAQLEVVFGTAPSPLEISSALESLSIAYSRCGEEIKTLQSPAIAKRYLALRGWSANMAPSETKGQ
jgi:hypothetical protein